MGRLTWRCREGQAKRTFSSLCVCLYGCALHAITRNNEIASAVVVGQEYYIIMFHSDKSFRFPFRFLRFPVRTNIHPDAPVVVLTERPHTVIFLHRMYLPM